MRAYIGTAANNGRWFPQLDRYTGHLRIFWFKWVLIIDWTIDER